MTLVWEVLLVFLYLNSRAQDEGQRTDKSHKAIFFRFLFALLLLRILKLQVSWRGKSDILGCNILESRLLSKSSKKGGTTDKGVKKMQTKIFEQLKMG